MDFHLSEEQSLIQSSAAEIAQGLIDLPVKDALHSLADVDFLGLFYPEESGGAGGDFLSYILALEEIAKFSPADALAYAIHCTQAGYVVHRFGSKTLREKYAAEIFSGKKIGAFAYGESWPGKDFLSLETTAVKVGDSYVINGEKTFVYNGSGSDFVIVFASTEKGISAFLVDKELPGIQIGRPYRKMGLDLLDENSVTLTNVRIPEACLLGAEGEGQKIAKAAFELHSISLSAIAVGIGHRAIDKTISYGKERKQFNRPILSFESLSERVGRMFVDIGSAELLTYKAAMKKDDGEELDPDASSARYFAIKTSEQTCIDAIQLHGGYGYSKDLGVEVLLRDLKGLSVFETLNKPIILTIASERIAL